MNNFDIKNKNLYNQKVQNTTAVVDNQAPDRMLSLTTNTFFFSQPWSSVLKIQAWGWCISNTQ